MLWAWQRNAPKSIDHSAKPTNWKRWQIAAPSRLPRSVHARTSAKPLCGPAEKLQNRSKFLRLKQGLAFRGTRRVEQTHDNPYMRSMRLITASIPPAHWRNFLKACSYFRIEDMNHLLGLALEWVRHDALPLETVLGIARARLRR